MSEKKFTISVAVDNARQAIGKLKEDISNLPGPIGQAAQGFGGLTTAAKSFIATPIGAVIAGLTAVFLALKKGVESNEKAQFALNKLMGTFSGLIGPIVKGLGNLATTLIEGVTSGLNTVIGLLGKLGFEFQNSAEEGMKLADSLNVIEEAEGDLEVARAKQNKALAEAREILSDTTKSYKERKAALDEIRASEEALSLQEVDLAKKAVTAAEQKIKLYGESKENLDALDAATIKLANTEQSYAAKKRQFNREEKKLLKEQQQAQKEADDAKKKALEDAFIKESDVANKKNQALINQAKIAGEDTLALEIKKSEDLLEIQKKYGKDTFELEQKILMDKATLAKNAETKAKEEAKAYSEYLIDTQVERRDAEIAKEKENLDKILENKNLTDEQRAALQEAFGKRVAEINKKYADEEVNIELQKFEAKKNIQMAQLGVAAQAGQLLQEIAGKNKALAIAGLVIEKAASIGQIIASTSVANAKSVAASPLTAGMPWVAINTASGALSIASLIAQTAKSISQINSAETGGSPAGAGSGPSSSPSKFKNGGLLTGRLHANGGIMTPMGELEGGEFVVNRASTRAFLPMLQAINSAGVGVNVSSGNMSSSVENANMGGSQVIKTYVLASDVGNSLEARRKIEDLAKL